MNSSGGKLQEKKQVSLQKTESEVNGKVEDPNSCKENECDLQDQWVKKGLHHITGGEE